MTDNRKDNRSRLKLPNDLFEVFEARAKHRNLSNVDLLRELLENADRVDRTTAELAAQRSGLDSIVETIKDVTSSLDKAQLAADTRHKAVISELSKLRPQTVELGTTIHAHKASATVPSRSTEKSAPRPVKRRGFEFTYWHLAMFIATLAIGYFGGLYSR